MSYFRGDDITYSIALDFEGLMMNPLASSDYCLKWNDHHNVFFSTGII